MQFNKDLLLIDLEFSGIDVSRHEILQIAALLLDKTTLEEKDSFSTYIKPEVWENRDPEAMSISQITLDQVKGAPSLFQVLSDFGKKFPKGVILTNYGGIADTVFLQAAYNKVGLPYQFDYHVFNLWPLCFTFMAKKNMLQNREKFVGFELEDILKYFGIPIVGRHDALGDCRVEAELLRRLIKEL